MDLLDAMALARDGRGQAESEGEATPPRVPDLTPVRRARPAAPTDDEIAPRLTPSEWRRYVDDVAAEIVDRLNVGRHWYDLSEEKREEVRRLAKAAILAVAAVDVQASVRRIRERTEKVAA